MSLFKNIQISLYTVQTVWTLGTLCLWDIVTMLETDSRADQESLAKEKVHLFTVRHQVRGSRD